MPELPDVLNVLVMQRVSDQVLARIKAIAPERINLITPAAEFVKEMQTDWPPAMAQRFSQSSSQPTMTDDEREEMVRTAHVVFGGMPYPKTFPRRAKNLIWAHFGFAGLSNLMGSDWWATPFITTSARGYTGALPIAEATIAGMFAMAKKLDVAVLNGAARDFDPAPYSAAKLISGKTMGIVGLGGIGALVAKLAKGVGMRVIATRRSATSRQQDVDGVDELFPSADLHAMLAESDFVAVCAMWTPETERMMNAAAFEAMKPGAFLMNIARGELIENEALAAALHSGKVAGAYLDVWDDDWFSPPPQVLLDAPNIIYTPHVSNRTDVPHAFAADVFCDNLERLLKGEPLENIVDWERGY